MEDKKTWTLAHLPPSNKALGCKWVYKTKYNADGSIERYKAWLVVLGNHQIEGEDYNETFTPVACMVTARCILTIAISKGWTLHQMDVHNAFLHANLEEHIYMKPPLGFVPPSPNMVCKLNKSLYGLRQAPHQWYFKLATGLQDYGFKQFALDHSLFTYSRGQVLLALLVHVNYLVLTGNSSAHCVAFKSYLHNRFKLRDLGPLKYFLVIEVAWSPKGLFFVSISIPSIFSLK